MSNALKEFRNKLRNNPKKIELNNTRQTGKSITHGNVLLTVIFAAAKHASRMRGRYVLSHKGKNLRRHRLRRSFLDKK